MSRRLEVFDTESWVIGALLSADALLRTSAATLLATLGLTRDDFASLRMRIFFDAIQSLVNKGTPVDTQTVSGVAQTILGESPHCELEALQGASIATTETLRQHADTLRRLALLRRIAHHSDEQAKGTQKPGADPTVLLECTKTFLDSMAASTTGYRTADEDVLRIVEAQAAVDLRKRQTIVPTGIGIVDEAIGGFRCTLSVIGGMPSVGKSAFMATVIGNLLRQKVRVGLFALEDGSEAITSRLIAQESGIPWGDIATRILPTEKQGAFQDACGEVHRLTQNLEKFDGEEMTAGQLLARARDWVVNREVKIIFIDHLGELEPEPGRDVDHHRQVRRSLKALRAIAERYEVPVVVLAHFNREAARAGRPALHHFAESEYIGRMARLALGLWQGDDETRLGVMVLKNTRGSRGATGNRCIFLLRDASAALVQNAGGRIVELPAIQ